MEFLSDIFLAAGAFSAAVYCMVLSRRVNKLRGLDQDLGGAIAVLSTQVDEMTKLLTDAQTAAKNSTSTLEDQTKRAETISEKLEILVSAFDAFEVPAELMPEPEHAPEIVPAPEPQPEPESAAEAKQDADLSVFMRSNARIKAVS